MSRHDKNAVDTILDIGATADWIGPLWGAARNATTDGTELTIHSDYMTWAQMTLKNAGIQSWGWSILSAQDNLTAFSVHRDDVPRVNEVLGMDYVVRNRWHSGCTLGLMLLTMAIIFGIVGGFVLMFTE